MGFNVFTKRTGRTGKCLLKLLESIYSKLLIIDALLRLFHEGNHLQTLLVDQVSL
jgi:hypothetical protein